MRIEKQRKKICRLVVLAVCFFGAVTVAEEFPAGFVGFDALYGRVYRGNAMRTGEFQASGVPRCKGISWSFDTGKAVVASPIAVDGNVFVGSTSGSFYCLDGESGDVEWKYQTGSSVYGSAAVVGGRVFFLSADRVLHVLDAETGALIWKKDIKGQANRIALTSPAVAYGIVFVNSGGVVPVGRIAWVADTLLGFDVISGRKVFEQFDGWGPHGIMGPAISLDGYLCFRRIGINLETGVSVEQKKPPRPVGPWNSYHHSYNCGAISGDYYVDIGMRAGDTAGTALVGAVRVNAYKTGKVIWALHPYEPAGKMPKPGPPEDGKDHSILTAPCVAENNVFVGSNDGILYQFDLETGRRGWTYEIKEPIQSSASYADGILYFGAHDKQVHAISAKTGKAIWTQPCGGTFISSPAIVDGAVYIGCDDGKIYCIQ